MKHAVRTISLVLALAVLAAGSAFANGTKESSAAAGAAKAPRIGVSLPTQAAERWVRDKEKMEAEFAKLGLNVKVQIANEDAGRQISQCENMFAQGLDVLIIAPHDAKAAATIVEKAHAQGVKVISYDRLILDSDVDLYLSFDNVKVGEIQGQYLTKLMPKGNYAILAGAPTDNNAKLFREGAMKYIQPLVDKGDIKIVADQWVKDWANIEAMKIMENALTANANRIDAVLAPNDGTAGACIEALAAQGLAGKVPVTGQDAELAAAQRIVKGLQAMTVYKDTRELGAKAVELAVMMARGQSIAGMINNKVSNGKIDVPSVLLTPVAVDKANIDKVLIDGGYLRREDVYRK